MGNVSILKKTLNFGSKQGNDGVGRMVFGALIREAKKSGPTVVLQGHFRVYYIDPNGITEMEKRTLDPKKDIFF